MKKNRKIQSEWTTRSLRTFSSLSYPEVLWGSFRLCLVVNRDSFLEVEGNSLNIHSGIMIWRENTLQSFSVYTRISLLKDTCLQKLSCYFYGCDQFTTIFFLSFLCHQYKYIIVQRLGIDSFHEQLFLSRSRDYL